MIEKQFGVDYGPALQRGDKTACIVSLQAEIDRLGGVPYGWVRIYEALLFGFYNPRTGHCFPSHRALALKARCGTRTVQRALKWARENNLIHWSHGIVRDGCPCASMIQRRSKTPAGTRGPNCGTSRSR